MDWRPEMTPLGEQAAANPAQNGITGIDHPVIAVRDMEEARQTFMRLGFTVPPRGSHVEWGTGNWCIMFTEDYLELRGIIDTDRPLQGLDSFIDNRGEGLMGVAFGTRNAKQARALLLGSGIGVRKFTSLTRNFEHPGGWTQPQFNLCFPVEGYTLALDFKLDKGLFPLLDELDRIVLDYGGRLYLAKDVRMSEATFKQSYPRWEQLAEVRKQYGADKVFNSLQSERLGI